MIHRRGSGNTGVEFLFLLSVDRTESKKIQPFRQHSLLEYDSKAPGLSVLRASAVILLLFFLLGLIPLTNWAGTFFVIHWPTGFGVDGFYTKRLFIYTTFFPFAMKCVTQFV